MEGSVKSSKATDIPLEKKVSVVVIFSEADESPEEAVKSIIENHSFFQDVHFVKFGYSSQADLYPEWSADLEKLQELGLDPMWHSELDATKLKTRAAVKVAPDLYFADGAMMTLLKDMEYHSSCDHFAVSSVTLIESKSRDPRDWLQSLSYGFLLVIMMFDTMRSVVSLFQHHRTTDLRAHLVTSTWPNRVRMAPDRWWMWWFGTGVSTTKRAGSACMQVPAQKDQGLGFVLRTVKTHRQMGIGLWWILGYLLYYCFLALPWWNAILSPNYRISAWLIRDVYAWHWVMLYGVHTLVVGYIAMTWMKLPFGLLPLQVLLYTVYLTLSPLIFFYGRFHLSRAAWVAPSKRKHLIQKNE